MSNTLVTPDDLSDFPGAPFSDLWVDIAAESVRAEAGWHIAPEVTETIMVRSNGGCEIVLPSRLISSVALVGGSTDYTLFPGGVLYRRTGWPCGPLQVTLTHGYPSVPVDLLPVLATRARSVSSPRDPGIASQTTGPYSVTYRDGGGSSAGVPVPARFRVSVGVA